MSYLNVVSMLSVSSLHCYVHVTFELRFYADRVAITLLRSCHIWTSFLCRLCRHYIVPFITYLEAVSIYWMCRHCIVTFMSYLDAVSIYWMCRHCIVTSMSYLDAVSIYWMCRYCIVTFMSYLDVVSMCRLFRHYNIAFFFTLKVVFWADYVVIYWYGHLTFVRCFYFSCVKLLRSCNIWTSFVCRLCRHCIVTFLSYFGRRFYVDCVVISLLRSCHILDVVSMVIVSS